MRLAYFGNICNDAYLSCRGMHELGVDAELHYPVNSFPNTIPAWEDGDVNEETLGPNLGTPNPRAFKFTEPEWCHPFLEGTFESAYRVLTSNFDVVVGLWPFAVAVKDMMRLHWTVMTPWVIYESGMIRNISNPAHDSNATLAAYKMSPYIVYVNVDMEPLLLAAGLQPEQLTYVPLAIDTEKLTPAERPHDHTIFLHPTRHYNWEKGNDKLIAAFKEYVKRNPTAELRMCGWGGEDMQTNQMLVYTLNLTRNVTWLPLLSKRKLLEEYRRADVVFDHFTYPGLGSTEAEAMSCGKPVVSRIQPEFFMQHHGSAPPIVNAQTSPEIYEAMVTLEDENERKRLGREGREWAVRKQSLKVVAEQELAVYKRAAATR